MKEGEEEEKGVRGGNEKINGEGREWEEIEERKEEEEREEEEGGGGGGGDSYYSPVSAVALQSFSL